MADQSDRPEPDHTEDPRGQGTAQGYPETNQEGATPREGTEEGPEAGAGGADAPSTSSSDESGPRNATGNPDAAGAGAGDGD